MDAKNSDFKNTWYEYEQIVKQLKSINTEKIESTAKSLEDLSFSFTLGNLDKDLFRMNKEDFLNILDEIKELSVTDIEEKPTIFDPPQNHSPSLQKWADKTKLKRAEVLLEKFLFLQSLREDIPEAWDEVNELFYDD